MAQNFESPLISFDIFAFRLGSVTYTVISLIFELDMF